MTVLVLCLLCVMPLVCSSYSSFAPISHFFSSWWQRDCELFTHTLVLPCSPSTSSRQPQTTHVFADSEIALPCHALRVCVAHAPAKSCPFSLLVYWAFRACYRNQIVFHYGIISPCHNIYSFKRPFRGSRFERLDNSFVLLIRTSLTSSYFTPRKFSFCQMTVWTLGCVGFDDSCQLLCHPASDSKKRF